VSETKEGQVAAATASPSKSNTDPAKIHHHQPLLKEETSPERAENGNFPKALVREEEERESITRRDQRVSGVVRLCMYVCMYVREIPPTSQKAETTKTKDGKAKAKAKAKQVANSDVLPMHGIYIYDIIPSRWKKRHEEASLSW
jgi:hypothetical protein